MNVQKPHGFFERHNQTARVEKLAVLLMAVVCFVALAMVVVPGASPASPTSSPDLSTAAAKEAGASAAATATPSVPAAVQRDFYYFPNNYVNQATTIEEPVATF